MTWRVQHTHSFLKELAQLPAPIRKRVESLAFGEDIKRDPFLAGRTQKLSGYSHYYKIRIGD